MFIADDRFARDFYQRLTGSDHLSDSLATRSLVPVQVLQMRRRGAQVLSASGATPAIVTLARFHAPHRCGYRGIVTELVLAFPSGPSRSNIPAPHTTVVAWLDPRTTFVGGAGAVQPALARTSALELLHRIAARATQDAPLVRPLELDQDQAADAGEVIPLGGSYGVGFRARVQTARGDTVLVTGVASTDRELRRVRWIVKPRRIALVGNMIPDGRRGRRYSLRGAVAGNGVLVLVHEIADVAAGDSRATAVDVASGRVLAAQPLALRCP